MATKDYIYKNDTFSYDVYIHPENVACFKYSFITQEQKYLHTLQYINTIYYFKIYKYSYSYIKYVHLTLARAHAPTYAHTHTHCEIIKLLP